MNASMPVTKLRPSPTIASGSRRCSGASGNWRANPMYPEVDGADHANDERQADEMHDHHGGPPRLGGDHQISEPIWRGLERVNNGPDVALDDGGALSGAGLGMPDVAARVSSPCHQPRGNRRQQQNGHDIGSRRSCGCSPVSPQGDQRGATGRHHEPETKHRRAFVPLHQRFGYSSFIRDGSVGGDTAHERGNRHKRDRGKDDERASPQIGRSCPRRTRRTVRGRSRTR